MSLTCEGIILKIKLNLIWGYILSNQFSHRKLILSLFWTLYHILQHIFFWFGGCERRKLVDHSKSMEVILEYVGQRNSPVAPKNLAWLWLSNHHLFQKSILFDTSHRDLRTAVLLKWGYVLRNSSLGTFILMWL